MCDSVLKVKPISKVHTIAEHYWHDSKDFISRFDKLLPDELTKTGRIKRFVDLLMAAECALKCHIALGSTRENPRDVYQKIKNCSHSTKKLALLANYLPDKSVYNNISNKLGEFSVFIRYSLDAYDYFFPLNVDRDSKKNKDRWEKYSRTVANQDWLLKVKQEVEKLNTEAAAEFNGFITDDIAAILESEFQP